MYNVHKLQSAGFELVMSAAPPCICSSGRAGSTCQRATASKGTLDTFPFLRHHEANLCKPWIFQNLSRHKLLMKLVVRHWQLWSKLLTKMLVTNFQALLSPSHDIQVSCFQHGTAALPILPERRYSACCHHPILAVVFAPKREHKKENKIR